MTPVFAWLPSIGSSNLIEVTGFDSRWDGDLLVASLKATSLFRLRLEGTRVLYSEPIWIGQRIRDIAELRNGSIVLWTDDAQLLFISVDRERLDRNVRPGKQLSNAVNGGCMYLPSLRLNNSLRHRTDFEQPVFTKDRLGQLSLFGWTKK